ncbi:hypothetical protein NMG60_11035760 [Bertholletia excelsa]
MLPRIIFCISVFLAILTVVLLALFSPVAHRKNTITPWLALSLYIQVGESNSNGKTPFHQPISPSSSSSSYFSSELGALVFHRKLTEGPENTSRVVGNAQGFIIPVQHFARSEFNIIYLTFHTKEYSGSLSVEAKNFNSRDRAELAVVGGTGSFAFARGQAVFSQTNQQQEHAISHLKLHLKFPNGSQTIPAG